MNETYDPSCSPRSVRARSAHRYNLVLSELERGLEVSVADLADLAGCHPQNIHSALMTYNLRLQQEDRPHRIRVRRDCHKSYWRLVRVA